MELSVKKFAWTAEWFEVIFGVFFGGKDDGMKFSSEIVKISVFWKLPLKFAVFEVVLVITAPVSNRAMMVFFILGIFN
jgi:hypothetical protein